MDGRVVDSLSGTLVRWVDGLTLEAIPKHVVADAKLRILDTIGVIVAASVTDAGRIVRDAALRLGPGDTCRVFGFGFALVQVEHLLHQTHHLVMPSFVDRVREVY